MTDNSGLRVISIGLDLTIALDDPSKGSRGDAHRRQAEYAELSAGYTAIVKTPRSSRYRPYRWGDGHAVIPTLSASALNFPRDAYRLAAEVYRERGADLVVTQDPFSTGLAGYWLKKRLGIPLCIQVHNDMIGCEWWMRESRANRLMEPLGAWLVRRADTVQVVSHTIRDRLTARGMASEKAWNIMTGAGIDATQFESADGASLRAQLLGDRYRRLVLFMGRLVKQKDLPTLLKAASIVARKNPDTLFLLVGDGEERGYLERLVPGLGLETNLRIPGGVGPTEAPTYFAACDLFVMSSVYEGKARALVEAACAAKPIVTTAVSGADEVVDEGKTGYLVPLKDPSALADRILRVLDDPQRAAEMGQRGRA
ncbi:MAG TPA: glycosyltransferase family 4 protein, partial [Chloroflexota bacterium]|nr:glycosyltransferase family 4 protein [Chloroflexota bacterium]